MPAAILAKALTAAEQRELGEIEDQIRACLDAIELQRRELARLFSLIRRKRLYRPHTWEEYCGKWEVSGRHGNRLAAYGDLLDVLQDLNAKLGEATPTPATEREARPIAGRLSEIEEKPPQEQLRILREAEEAIDSREEQELRREIQKLLRQLASRLQALRVPPLVLQALDQIADGVGIEKCAAA